MKGNLSFRTHLGNVKEAILMGCVEEHVLPLYESMAINLHYSQTNSIIPKWIQSSLQKFLFYSAGASF